MATADCPRDLVSILRMCADAADAETWDRSALAKAGDEAVARAVAGAEARVDGEEQEMATEADDDTSVQDELVEIFGVTGVFEMTRGHAPAEDLIGEAEVEVAADEAAAEEAEVEEAGVEEEVQRAAARQGNTRKRRRSAATEFEGSSKLPKSTAELMVAMAKHDLGVSSDRSSTVAAPGLAKYNAVAAPSERVGHRRGQPLPEGFVIVKVRAALATHRPLTAR